MEQMDAFQRAAGSVLLVSAEIAAELRQKQMEEQERELKKMEAEQSEMNEQSRASKKMRANRYIRDLEEIKFGAPPERADLHRLFNPDQVRAAARAAILGNAEDDRRQRTLEIVQQLADSGTFRRIRRLPENWADRVSRLEDMFPNMAEPLRFLRSMFSLSAAGDGFLHFPPMALDGPPGVGKTFFCSILAETFGTELKIMRIEQQQDGCGLTGSSQFWANTHPGLVFESLVQSRFANEIFIIDEIDKAAGDARYNPLAGLFQLLEPETAKSFADLSYPWLKMDASRILWVATSNAIDQVPQPIQSRLRVFSIPAPSPEESRGIVRRMYEQECRKRLPCTEMGPLSDEVIDRLSFVPPRRIRLALTEAIGMALSYGRHILEVSDIQERGSSKRGIGFLTSN